MSADAAVPRLTIGLPVHNGETYLAQSLDALLAQTFGDFELIVSDNASTDRTGEIAARYAAADPRVRYLRHTANLGSAENHNLLVRVARGELFKWASDDDLYAPDLLQRCVDALDRRPEVVLAHSWTAFIDEDGQLSETRGYHLDTDSPVVGDRFRSMLYVQGGDDFYGVVRTGVLRHTQPIGSYHNADRVFVTDLALHGRFHQVPEPLYYRRDHPGRAGRRRSLRGRCVVLDPRREDRWRHPVVRLAGEYLGGYVRAILAAPIGWRDRLTCLRHLGVWAAVHADPRRSRQLATSPDPAVRARARGAQRAQERPAAVEAP